MNPAYAVPAAFGLAMLPHFGKVAIMSTQGSVSPSNKSGRPDLKNLEGKITQDRYDLACRLGAAHTNGMEGLALFAGGVAFAVAARAPPAEVARKCAIYIASRVGFLVVYALPPVAHGLPRTLCWAVSTFTALSLWWGAAGLVA